MRLVLCAISSVILQQPRDTLRSFTSDAEFVAYYREFREAQERARRAADSAYRLRAEASERCRRKPVDLKIMTLSGAGGARAAVIGGRVVDADGAPVPAARVVIGPLKLSTAVGRDGGFSFVLSAEALSAPRQVTVEAAAIGYFASKRTFTVSRGDSVEMTVRMCDMYGGLYGMVALQGVVVTDGAVAEASVAKRAGPDQITNTQHVGVDEGGIVKVHGDHLVVLRRGRLFTIAIGDSALQSGAAVPAFGPDVDPRYTWYDELLVAGDKVVVIGYSYQRGGTEVGVFNINPAGALKYVATYQLRSNDYYSARNYASRLIGTKLIFYAPLYLWGAPDNILAALPAARRWYRGAKDSAFKRIAPAPRIYRSPQPLTGNDIALHTVTVCDLAQKDLGCEATVIVGPSGRVFYVSAKAVYVWASSWSSWGRGTAGMDQRAMLYRMPLDGSAPSALDVAGTPVDQFSFLETEEGQLNVLVRSDAYGDAMWLPEWARGDIALLRLPIDAFGDGGDRVPWWRYSRLPQPQDSGRYAFHNRFVGRYLLYGMGSGWGLPKGDSTTLFAVRWTANDDDQVSRLRLRHGVDRIEAMGDDAVIVGANSSDLHFTGIQLAKAPSIAQRYTMAGASQGELRSHGFFYRMDSADAGVLGLPVSGAGRRGYRHLLDGSAGVLFLRNSAQRFAPLGVLKTTARAGNDHCRASCIDWYGNARPIFLAGRVFALLGYELVEGTIAGDEIAESRRISFAPGERTVAR